jgi:hypothetical protein
VLKSRVRRHNTKFHTEEFAQSADFERECVEEDCDQEELFETADELADNAKIRKWEKYEKCKEILREEYGELGTGWLSTGWQNKQLPECMADEDQCASSPCNSEHTVRCHDKIKDYRCECEYGYGKKDCGTLVNYCVNNPCVNGMGGEKGDGCTPKYDDYSCNCQLNWEGKNCEKEIRDCRRELLEASDEQFQCVNGDCSVEQKKCLCAPGWVHSSSGFDVCDQDEDECVTGTHECEHQCVNTIGSYDCKCDKGYIKSSQNSNECDDVDECRHNNGGCEEFCVNTEGSFQCSCPEGFTLDMRYERRCYDDDECEKDNGGCSQKCKNTHGSFYCGCDEGYYLDEDRLTCRDLDECHPKDLPEAARSQDLNPSLKMFLAKMEPNGNCQQNCVNTDGSFHCTCDKGYHLLSDGFTCIDDDECLNETDECSQKCINTEGSYDCSCNQGYKLDTASDTRIKGINLDSRVTGKHATTSTSAPRSSTTVARRRSARILLVRTSARVRPVTQQR